MRKCPLTDTHAGSHTTLASLRGQGTQTMAVGSAVGGPVVPEGAPTWPLSPQPVSQEGVQASICPDVLHVTNLGAWQPDHHGSRPRALCVPVGLPRAVSTRPQEARWLPSRHWAGEQIGLPDAGGRPTMPAAEPRAQWCESPVLAPRAARPCPPIASCPSLSPQSGQVPEPCVSTAAVFSHWPPGNRDAVLALPRWQSRGSQHTPGRLLWGTVLTWGPLGP